MSGRENPERDAAIDKLRTEALEDQACESAVHKLRTNQRLTADEAAAILKRLESK